MKRILFICHGNICRSVASEYVMKDILKKCGRTDEFLIDSAATSTEEIGNSIYPPMERTLRNHGIPIGSHRARQIRREDYDKYDYLIGMDGENIWNMNRVWSKDPEQKIYSLLDFTDHPREVSDPWYTRDFEKTYQDVVMGCEALLRHLEVEQ